MRSTKIESKLYSEVAQLGAKDMEACMQCGNCAASCPLSQGENTFPRKIYRYLQLGLRDKLLSSAEPWLCYYCGDCNKDCPRGAEPAETMMASRRWLTTQYDWTGLASRFYTSPKWEVGAFLAIAFFVIGLFLAFHGEVITDRVALNTFAPAHWVHIGDEIMVLIVIGLLLSNAFNMYRKITAGVDIPWQLYVKEFPTFIINYFTQKKWRKCGTGPASAWWRHLFLFSGWVIMEILVMIFLTSFQTDIVHPFWHPTRIFGYYATIALLLASGSMLYSRWYKKESTMHRYSDFTDMFFLVLIFLIALTGIMVHFVRLAGLPLTTYTLYVIHVAICVAMLMIMIPFGKLSHLMYRPLAIFLTSMVAKAQQESEITPEEIKESIGDSFQSCMQCGACTASCPKPMITQFSPRQILRNIALDRASNVSVDKAAWECVTCDSCVQSCPRGIPLSDMMLTVRQKTDNSNMMPKNVNEALASLEQDETLYMGARPQDIGLEKPSKEHDYALFNCCRALSAPQDHPNSIGTLSLTKLLQNAGFKYGSLSDTQSCCGDLARVSGKIDLFHSLQKKHQKNLSVLESKTVISSSPHCFSNLKELNQENISIEHTTQTLAELIQAGTIKPQGSRKICVTYHDPCYLGKKNGVYDAPRSIIKAIPDISFVEMPNSKQQSQCCGGGGSGVFQHSESSLASAKLRLEQAMATGATHLITSCPYCIEMFERAIKSMKVEDTIQIQDINTLLLESIEISGDDAAALHQERKDQEEIHV